MVQGLEMHARRLLVQQAALFTFEGDVSRFIETGEMAKRKPVPSTPALEAKIAEIKASGGRLIIDGSPAPESVVTQPGAAMRPPKHRRPPKRGQ